MREYKGLSDKEVADSRGKYGNNKLPEAEQDSFLKQLWDNYIGDPLLRILTVACIAMIAVSFMGQDNWIEGITIFCIILLVTGVSTLLEYKNSNLLREIQKVYADAKCRVFRNGKIVVIPIEELVVGDKVILEAGDRIPADGVIIDGAVKVNQASLNGESEEFSKESVTGSGNDLTSLFEEDTFSKSSVFRGSVVTEGEAVFQVARVGAKSMLGQITEKLLDKNTDFEDTTEHLGPLKVKLTNLADSIAKMAYVAGVLAAITLGFREFVISPTLLEGATTYFSLANWVQIFADVIKIVVIAITIIVVAVPEGLPMMIAIVCGRNMKNLLKQNILIRKIDGAETAGSTNILFTDKTGTLTTGVLQVSRVFWGIKGESGIDSLSKCTPQMHKRVIEDIWGGSVCSLISQDSKLCVEGGNGTERALMQYILESNSTLPDLKKLDNVLFTSDRKYSAYTISTTEGEQVTIVKGAPERILSKCKTDSDGNVLDQAALISVEGHINNMASACMRVIAFARTDKDSAWIRENGLPQDMTLEFYVGIRDELRKESKQSIALCKEAGIQVVMVTGDRLETAIAIAKDAGLLSPEFSLEQDTIRNKSFKGEIALTHDELVALPDEELQSILPQLRVIARAQPMDKLRLVRCAKKLDLTVSMTGDGVNDAPALKEASVGFAMESGTEVAKEAAQITILDNNFKSIVTTILYGRTIYNNIQKFIVFQMTINLAALLIAIICPLLGIDHPLAITQMLWVNMIMDTLAAIALGGEPVLERYMHEKPKRRKEAIVTKRMWTQIVGVGLYIVATSFYFLFGGFARGMLRPSEQDIVFMTGFFCFFVFSIVLNALNARTDSIMFLDNIEKNPTFMIVIGGILLLQVGMSYIGGQVMRTVPLELGELWFVFVMSMVVLPVGMLIKALNKAIRQ